MLARLGWTLIILGSVIAVTTGILLIMHIDGDLSMRYPIVFLVLAFSLALPGALCIEIVQKRKRIAGSDFAESVEYRTIVQVLDRATVVLLYLGVIALIAALVGLAIEQEALSKESILPMIIVDGALIAGLFWMHRRLKGLLQSESSRP